MEKIRVFIVDDHPIILDGMRQLIDDTEGITVVGCAATGRDCRKLLKEKEADVILLDINLPDASGLDLCLYIQENYSNLKVLALSGFSEYFYIKKMMSNGAKGYLLKNAMPEEIIEGIVTVAKGGEYLSEEAGQVVNSGKEGRQLFLTVRETELLKLIVEGYTNREIADQLCLGVETINSYRKNLLIKLGVKNTAAMVKLAITERLV